MKKSFSFFILSFVISLSVSAKTGIDSGNEGINQQQIKKLQSLFSSRVWQPVDSVSYKLMIDLISYIESTPVDSVILGLQKNLSDDQPFFKRSIYNVPEVESIRGYVTSREINYNYVDIEKRVHDEHPYESIMVPESKFFGMYSKLPIITYSNMDRLISDSLIELPDTVKILMEEIKHAWTSRKVKENKALIDALLDVERKKYNDLIIENFRDSVTRNYREQFLGTRISALKKTYSDSVSRINSRILRSYNDSVVSVVNSDVRGVLTSLVAYINRQPQQISIFNLKNEASVLPLQNDTVWYKWVWLKNANNDSIGVRIENLGRNSFKALVDETINLSRLTQRQTVEVGRIVSSEAIDQQLLKINRPVVKTSPWKLDGKAYSGFTQTYINDYWSKGGKSSASTLSTFNYSANYSSKKMKWENWVDAKLGLIYYPPEEGSTALRNWHKNSDNFEINSRLGLSAFKKWYYSAEANFKTQFFWGFKSNNDSIPNSAWFSPAYLTFSGGFDYKPNNDFSAFISPLSIKTTYVTNPDVNETVFGLIEGRTRKSRIGMGGKIEFNKKLMDNVMLRSKNSIFINFGYNNYDELQLFKVPDFDTENTIDFKVNQFITTQVNMHFIYDKDVESKWKDKAGIEQKGTKLQVKEFFTLGISYKF